MYSSQSALSVGLNYGDDLRAGVADDGLGMESAIAEHGPLALLSFSGRRIP